MLIPEIYFWHPMLYWNEIFNNRIIIEQRDLIGVLKMNAWFECVNFWKIEEKNFEKALVFSLKYSKAISRNIDCINTLRHRSHFAFFLFFFFFRLCNRIAAFSHYQNNELASEEGEEKNKISLAQRIARKLERRKRDETSWSKIFYPNFPWESGAPTKTGEIISQFLLHISQVETPQKGQTN